MSDDILISLISDQVQREHRRSKTVHDKLSDLHQVYGLSPDRKRFTTVSEKGRQKVKKSSEIGLKHHSLEDMQDELLLLKKSLKEQRSENRSLTAKVRFLERESAEKNRELEEIISISPSDDKGQQQLRKSEILVRSLKQALRGKDSDIAKLNDELSVVRQNIRFTRVAELEMELKSNFQEILRLRRLLERSNVAEELSRKTKSAAMSGDAEQLNGSPEELSEARESVRGKGIEIYVYILLNTCKALSRQILLAEQTIEQLRDKEGISAQTITELQAQIKDMLIENETREAARSSMDSQSYRSRRQSFVYGRPSAAMETIQHEEEEHNEKNIQDQWVEEKIRLNQVITQLRSKEDISNKTIADLQFQINSMLADNEVREEERAKSIDRSRRTSFVHGSALETIPSEPALPSSDATTVEQQALRASRKRPSLVLSVPPPIASLTNGNENDSAIASASPGVVEDKEVEAAQAREKRKNSSLGRLAASLTRITE